MTRISSHARLMWWLAGGCLLALAVFLGLSLVDHAQILGISRWIKPAKFAASIAIFAGTMALLAGPIDSARWVCRIAFLAMVAELTLITIQAGRATTSHFNNSTPLDAAIFAVMGLLILVNTIAVAFLYRDYVFRPPYFQPATISAIRSGLFLFLIASLEGFVMVALNAHTVGARDGGPGLPLVNWSTLHGDLRVAHFFGMHALQVLPLTALLLPNRTLIRLLALAWLAAFAFLLGSALSGHPLLPR